MKVELAQIYRNTDVGREAAALLSPCVQCGQCTFTCPTFRLLGDEWDGPRGRIFLIKQFFEGKEPSLDLLPPALSLKSLAGRTLGANLQLHLDRCLTCRSCETSCPQGVRYGRLLDLARERVDAEVRRPARERLARRAVRYVISHRGRFTALLRVGQAVRRFLPDNLRARIPERRTAGPWPDRGHARTMLVWQGCVQPALAPDINAASARVLDRFGIRLVPVNSVCCGGLSQHMGATGEAQTFMRKVIDDLWPHVEAGAEAIVLTASGCGMYFRDYAHLMQNDAHYRDKAKRISQLTRDIAEVVLDEWSEDESTPIRKPQRRIAFQASCSLQHGEKLNGVVEKLLKRAGFKLMPVAYAFMCCGAAGTYSVLQRKLALSLRDRKLTTLLQGRPELIATANIGCIAHLDSASPVPVHHWIELLDDAVSKQADAEPLSRKAEIHRSPAALAD